MMEGIGTMEQYLPVVINSLIYCAVGVMLTALINRLKRWAYSPGQPVELSQRARSLIAKIEDPDAHWRVSDYKGIPQHIEHWGDAGLLRVYCAGDCGPEMACRPGFGNSPQWKSISAITEAEGAVINKAALARGTKEMERIRQETLDLADQIIAPTKESGRG
jgi:hypothetical protein